VSKPQYTLLGKVQRFVGVLLVVIIVAPPKYYNYTSTVVWLENSCAIYDITYGYQTKIWSHITPSSVKILMYEVINYVVDESGECKIAPQTLT